MTSLNSIIEMLSEGIAAQRGRYGAYLHRDLVNQQLRARRGARLAAITSGGAIPDTALFTVVVQPEEIVIGTLDEDFAVESNAGDIFLLGNTSWRITRVESRTGRVLVEDAHGAPPSVPFWLGEAPARTAELSHHVAELRERVSAVAAQYCTAADSSRSIGGRQRIVAEERECAALSCRRKCRTPWRGSKMSVGSTIPGPNS